MGASVLDRGLTPSNSQPLERALVRLWQMHLPDLTELGVLWDADRCPTRYLPYLAASLNVLFWDPLWPEGMKRGMIRWTIWLHQWAGTRIAMQEVLRVAGYTDAIITEAKDLPRIGDAPPLGSNWRLGVTNAKWADYWVDVKTPVTRRQANNLARLLGSVAPAFCRLRAIRVRDVHFTLGDGAWRIGRDIALGATYYFEETANA